MKTLLVAIIAVLILLPTPTALSSNHPTPPLLQCYDSQAELEMELSILKKIKLTVEQRQQLIKLEIELAQK